MEYLFLPATQALTAVSVFSTPKFSSQFSHAGILASRRSCARYVLALIGAAIVYSLFAFLFFGPLARHLLGAAYASATWMIPFFSFTLLLRALGDAGIGVILRGAHRPNAVFIASALSAAAVAGFGYPLCRLYGVSGLLYGSCFASLLQTGAYIWYYFREIRLAKLESAAATSPGPLDMQTTRS